MKIEAVTVSVNHGDFLAVTLPRNLPLFDHFIVVTTPEDHETREVCRRYGVKAVLTHDFFRDGAKFNKARGINKGLDQLANSEWVVHIDADVILPAGFRRAVQDADLDPEAIYGCDRVMVRTYRQWVRLRDSGYLQHDFHCRVNFPPGFEVGCRWANAIHGWCPIGFMQLWHSVSDIGYGIHVRPYPVRACDAARSDVQFSLLWDRRHRHLLPEVIAVHLESEPAKLGANWKGRKTRRFEAAIEDKK